MGQVGGKAVRMDVRDISAAYGELDRYLQTPEFLGFVSRVTGIPHLLYDPDYIGGCTHENRDGQGLDAHVDFNYHPRTKTHRRLNLIVYLNPRWDSAWGGELELHSDPWNAAADRVECISPLFNLCAIFETTESSWHGFSQITLPADAAQLSRKSFAIYLYTRERSAAQTRRRRTRLDAPLQPPAHAVALSLRSREAVRRADRRTRTCAGGGARHAAAGIAGLRGAEVAARFVPTKPASGLELELWSPPQIGADPQVQIELAGNSFAQSLRAGALMRVSLPLRMREGEDVALNLRADRTCTPAADGNSGDQRALAYRIVSAVLKH